MSRLDLDDAALKRIGGHLRRCRCGRFSAAHPTEVMTGARLFLLYVHDDSEPAIRAAEPAAVEPPLLRAFGEWMRAQRGTSDPTLYNYGIPIRKLLRRIGENPRSLGARELRRFVLAQSQAGGVATAKRSTTALRMFLRFLIAKGRCRAGLLGAIPVVANWRLATLPKYLPSEDIERMIASCDHASPTRRRDRAILLLLARLGLRAGDIVQLRLHDIDWKGGWIQVSGKNRRETRLPLSQEVGQALVAYLHEERPRSRVDSVFLRSLAPHRALTSHAAVSVLVAKAMHRTGVKRPGRGAAHLLRHSVASSMLRGGSSLQEISALLRHRSIETTQIYAKVDVTALKEIAKPWPEVTSC